MDNQIMRRLNREGLLLATIFSIIIDMAVISSFLLFRLCWFNALLLFSSVLLTISVYKAYMIEKEDNKNYMKLVSHHKFHKDTEMPD